MTSFAVGKNPQRQNPNSCGKRGHGGPQEQSCWWDSLVFRDLPPLLNGSDFHPPEKTRQQLEILYSRPNIPTAGGQQPGQTLEKTILQWFGQTPERDGLKAEMATVTSKNDVWTVHLDGLSEEENARYAVRLRGLLPIGWEHGNVSKTR